MTDSDKTFRQYMLAKSPKELGTIKGHFFLPMIPVIKVSETNTRVPNVQKPVIADGYFVGVTPQIFHHLIRARKGLLGIDIPFCQIQIPEKSPFLWKSLE
jgi:hypothetical protein